MSSLLRSSASRRSIGIIICNYFSVRRISLHPKLARETTNKDFQNCITSIPLAVYPIWPFVFILSKPIVNYRSLATHASPDEEEVADEAFKQILSAVEANPSSSKETYAIYIKKLCKTGKISDAARLLQGALDKHIFLNPNTYNLFLVAAGEVNDTDLLCQIFKNLLLSFKSLDSTSYFNLAKAFSKVNDSIQLLKFVREISELTFPRSTTVIRRIISGFAEYKQIDKSLLIFDHMKNLKCKPDIITYNTVLAILGQAGRVDEMLHEFASMKESSMIPDIVSYSTLINSLRKVGRLDLCLVFLREMGKRGIEPDLRTYTALIDSFGRSGNVEESLRLLAEMKRRHVRPSSYVYRSLISSLKKVGKLELAKILLEEMKSGISDLVGPEDFKRKNR
ncbi:hypothetical protein HHK36_033359 [Tetracentron sinense]|uniref:Pentatricopeptide repeat-containing protein n=1 Tax=Tetracentron sinense TaxID=13715 RepID=A0A834Y3K0_TETSI|nr:hypothetical protein HHK36_033359 [Tetracentron sinense]